MSETAADGGGGLCAEALAAMGYALFRSGGDKADSVGELGDWALRANLPHGSEFLAEYCERVEAEGDDVAPAIWEEGGLRLEARGIEAGGRRLVAVRNLGDEFESRRIVVQRANERGLERRKLLKEIQKKELLLRCIVHDLGNPLATVIMNLQRAERQIDDASTRWSVQTALAQAVRQRSMIRSVLDLFSAEIASLEEFRFDPAVAPDLASLAKVTLTHCRALADAAGVELQLEGGGAPLPVRAEAALLERVLENLLANAVRHGGGAGRVVLRLERGEGWVTLSVLDGGPGVPTGMERAIFNAGTQAGPDAGQAGLGLFFCRRSVERWGGEIGCENREGGGARFWFRLRPAEFDELVSPQDG